MAVTLLAYLRYLQQHIAAAQQSADGECAEVKTVHNKVFTERARDDVRAALVECVCFFRAQKAYLPVPFSGVCVAVNTPLGRKMCGFDVVLLYAFTVACAYRDNFSHDFSSNIFR